MQKEQLAKLRKLYYETHKEELRIARKAYYTNHKSEIITKQLEYNNNHKDEYTKYQKQYYIANKKNLILKAGKYTRIKLDEDIYYKLKHLLRNRIRKAIKQNARHGSAVRDLGCSIEFFKEYIQSKFSDDMTWNNYSSFWILDHIVPLWKFDLTDRKQLLKAVHYTNLQPLTIENHRSKTIKEASERAQFKLRRCFYDE
jgi:hypothetical protein